MRHCGTAILRGTCSNSGTCNILTLLEFFSALSRPDQRGITAGGGPNNQARVFYLRWFVDIVVGDVVEEDRAAWLRSPTPSLDADGQKDNNGVRATLLPFHHCHGGGHGGGAPIEAPIEAPMNHTGPTALPLGQPTTWSFDRDVWPNTPTVRLPPTPPRVRLTRLSIEENGKTKRRNVEGVGTL